MTYETFRDTIFKILRSSKSHLTWTEIRTAAKLPQAFPNNQWVHKMEDDIHLQRHKDPNGIIRWSLKGATNRAPGPSPKAT
jgi:hypothetical protein